MASASSLPNNFAPCENCRAAFELVLKLSKQKTELIAYLERQIHELEVRAKQSAVAAGEWPIQ
jgi:hypothetical protein